MADRPTSKQQGEFHDPLENYEPKTYDDVLEQALCDETVTAIQAKPFATVTPDTPVHEAVKKLAALHHACLLVEDNGKLVGVFSDRDALDKVALEYEQVKDRPVREVMTDQPVYVYKTDSSAAALSVMAVSGYRHVPVVDLEENVVGIISPQRVTSYLQKYFESE